MNRPIVHLLKKNGAASAPYADYTLCGEKVRDDTSAMWPGQPLNPQGGYCIYGRWCKPCKALERAL